MRLPRQLSGMALAAALAGLAVAGPAHAWFGALAKLGSAAGKGAAGVAGKGAATGAGALVGVEAAEATNAAAHAAKAARAGTAAEGSAGLTAEQLAKNAGLGKAVPDDIAAMLTTPGKTLLDVPDVGTHAWLSMSPVKLKPTDANPMVRDYVKLLEGKPAIGPGPQTPVAASEATRLPTRKPAAAIPWQAIELLVRAAHLGHKGAQAELDRLCRPATGASTQPRPYCNNGASVQARRN